MSDVQVYTPFRRGLPRLGPYAREVWARRQFALELARTEIRTENTGTGLGQLWLVLNPLLLAFVYYVLTSILSGSPGGAARLAHIMAGLFLYYFFSSAVIGGAMSILSSSRLILNTAFPKMLLPISVVLVSFLRFLPSLGIYAVVHVLAGQPVRWQMLWGVVPLALVLVFATGLAMLLATVNLYFRDTKSFLPYTMRVWLYLSPVLWLPEQVRGSLAFLRWANPLFPLLGSWSEAVVEGRAPQAWMLGAGAAWAVVALLVGAWALLSREREFAVRL
ncbi:ABC transporter permease [Kineosporia sp. A_224]|uniref:ABC transporter permease n=1 Tax=Kineosporia sp. A_224 TaxID=1962180 RepID=UPI000B4BDB84|nr:ABC transporter permease [Kineosporia sp. A_224]